MNAMVKKNMDTLHEMYMAHPDSMQGLTSDDNYLVFGDERVDISRFDISTLFNEDNPFAGSLDELGPQAIFEIIKVHAEYANMGNFVLEDEIFLPEQTDEERLEDIKEDNPLMEFVTIVDKPTEFGPRQYFNIVDSTGKDNLFYNDMNIDIFSLYDNLRLQNGGQDVTPEELIAAIRRKLHEVELMNSTNDNVDLLEEEFKNKMAYQDQMYKGDKSISVYGNEEHDITLVNDDTDVSEHQVLTYDNNEHGDVVATTHNQNVNGVQTVNGEGETVSETNGVDEEVTPTSDTIDVEDDKKDEVESILIPVEQFYSILDSGAEMDDKMRHSVDLWYAFLQDLVLYEDFLNPELKDVLNGYRVYVEQLQLYDGTLNANQVEACDNLVLFEAKKQETVISKDGVEKVQQLQYVLKQKTIPQDEAAFVSYAQVIAIILAMAAILTAIAIYVIK